MKQLEVFTDMNTLAKFVSMRFDYMVTMIQNACSCVADLKIMDISSSCFTMLLNIDTATKPSPDDQYTNHRRFLVPYDILLSSQEWALGWSRVLAKSSSLDMLAAEIQEYCKVSPDDSQEVQAAKERAGQIHSAGKAVPDAQVKPGPHDTTTTAADSKDKDKDKCAGDAPKSNLDLPQLVDQSLNHARIIQ